MYEITKALNKFHEEIRGLAIDNSDIGWMVRDFQEHLLERSGDALKEEADEPPAKDKSWGGKVISWGNSKSVTDQSIEITVDKTGPFAKAEIKAPANVNTSSVEEAVTGLLDKLA